MKCFRPLIVLASVWAVIGCQTPMHYTKFRVTNYRGELVADWTAEGAIRKVDNGYRIKAVERTSAPPHAETTRYPNGWMTIVDGPHIVRWECGKPFWLYQLDGY